MWLYGAEAMTEGEAVLSDGGVAEGRFSSAGGGWSGTEVSRGRGGVSAAADLRVEARVDMRRRPREADLGGISERQMRQ